MLNLAEKYTKQIDVLLKEIDGFSVMRKTFSKLDISLVEEDSEAPIVSSYVKLRNSAMHADWTKIQGTDVGSLIGFLEPFLVKNFS